MDKVMTACFAEAFGRERPERLFFAPGRVNLIGEHTDYNGGHVFPCALTLGTYAAVSENDRGSLRLYSTNFSEMGIIERSFDDLDFRPEDDWANYPKGIARALIAEGLEIDRGLDICFHGNIPNGAGLSSSASIELVMAVLLDALFDGGFDRLTLVKLSQRVENQYIGVNCGIMDQFAIGMGKKDHAILLDTATLEYAYAPLVLGDHRLVITNTNQRRGLADSAYNTRRSECQEALRRLQTQLEIASLGDLDEKTFEDHVHLIGDEVLIRRARHAVSENRRTLRATQALDQGDLETFGRLMNDSHRSLRDDYEVSSIPLDTLVELALEVDGVLGTRMTGAGFGGCTVSIVRHDALETFEQYVGKAYTERTGLQAAFYIVDIGDGASAI